MFKVLAILAGSACLVACVTPTSYRAADTEGIRFGYSTAKLSEQLYRVRFLGSGRTPARWIDAFLLYRAAEVARDAGAPAFKIIEGHVDRSVLDGEDVYGHSALDLDATVAAAPVSPQTRQQGDRVVGRAALASGMQRTAGTMPIFRMPPPALPKYQPPVYIYTPTYVPVPLPEGSVLVELRLDLKSLDDKTFVTADVLDKLGPRIKRSAPKDPAANVPAPTAS
ncbi:hypothetical protein ABIC63_005769 [Pseudacidovorax sp. 1753]|uniref:CC0125/CC1285 family lipoprotein n=1 Tax=Pseudacidovorax sp. 1753 TaxID=3156419 RepID=UPI0033917C13